jgi:hypothetical protein
MRFHGGLPENGGTGGQLPSPVLRFSCFELQA